MIQKDDLPDLFTKIGCTPPKDASISLYTAVYFNLLNTLATLPMLWDKERERQCLELQISTIQDKEQLESWFRIIEPVGTGPSRPGQGSTCQYLLDLP